MTKDPSLAKFLKDRQNVESALLYAGYPATAIQEIRQIREDLGDDLEVLTGIFLDAQTMNNLYRLGTLAHFLTEMLRTGARPKRKDEFARHLRPLGLEWDRTTDDVLPTSTHPEVESLLAGRLEKLLEKIDPDLPNKLRGAWTAYYSENPDRYRHVVSSCRELLSDVTKRLGGNGQRKQRVRAILGSTSRAEVVEAAAILVDRLYDLQSAQEHVESDETTALFTLVETEHVLYFLLSHRV
jgi:hypothetical protein